MNKHQAQIKTLSELNVIPAGSPQLRSAAVIRGAKTKQSSLPPTVTGLQDQLPSPPQSHGPDDTVCFRTEPFTVNTQNEHDNYGPES